MRRKLLLALLVVCLLATASLIPADAHKQSPDSAVRREVAVTIDDLPAIQANSLKEVTEITRKLLRSLTANRVPAIGFVNEGKLERPGGAEAHTALLQMWLDAGMELGNHTYSHCGVDQTPLEAYEQDVIRGETVTRQLLELKGMKLRYFRHPYLHTGPTPEYKRGLDRFLAARGYATAPVTIDNNDYVFSFIYARAKARGDAATMRRVSEAYLTYMETIFEFFERLSREALGYEVRQTLLIHASALNADHFDDLAAMMKRRGYTFVSLGRALADPAYRLPDAQVKKGLSWIHRWMIAKGQEYKPEPLEPEFITKMYEAARR